MSLSKEMIELILCATEQGYGTKIGDLEGINLFIYFRLKEILNE